MNLNSCSCFCCVRNTPLCACVQELQLILFERLDQLFNNTFLENIICLEKNGAVPSLRVHLTLRALLHRLFKNIIWNMLRKP